MNFVNLLIYEDNGKLTLDISVLILIGMIYLLSIALIVIIVKVFCYKRKDDQHKIMNMNDNEQIPVMP